MGLQFKWILSCLQLQTYRTLPRSLLLVSFKCLTHFPTYLPFAESFELVLTRPEGGYESSKRCKSSLNAQASVCFVSFHIQNASRRLPELASCQHRWEYLPHKICASFVARKSDPTGDLEDTNSYLLMCQSSFSGDVFSAKWVTLRLAWIFQSLTLTLAAHRLWLCGSSS